MNKNLLSVVAVLVLLGVGAWYLSTRVAATPLTAEEDTAVRAMVTEFGTKLQFVPLLAVEAERKTTMELYYGPYVSAELIAAWAPEGTPEALGRYSSSPAPERIEIAVVEKTAPNRYTVEGNVIEVTSTEAGQNKAAAAVYPITLGIKKEGDKYMILSAEKGTYAQLPQRQTVLGYWECLPLKAESEGYSEDCITAIAIDQSDGHLVIDVSAMSRAPVNYANGTKVRASGVVTPGNTLSSQRWQHYMLDGIMMATSIEKAE